MNVSDFMTANPVTIDKDRKLVDALEQMAEIGCHHLPVVGHEGHLIGILSVNDCRRALSWPFLRRQQWQGDERAHRLSVGSVMTPAPIVTEPSDPSQDAAQLMLTHAIGCLPVLRAETLVGIVTISDVLIAFIHYQNLLSREETMYGRHSTGQNQEP